jgi:hypothetical protein
MPRSPPQFARLPNGARYSYGENGYDVLNAVVTNGERGLAGEALATTEACDLLVDDRVYPAFRLAIEDEVPETTAVWRFRERPKELGLIEPLFNRLGGDLAAEGYPAEQRQIVGASIIAVPIQRNSREEHRRIKAGAVAEYWSPATRVPGCRGALDKEAWHPHLRR